MRPPVFYFPLKLKKGEVRVWQLIEYCNFWVWKKLYKIEHFHQTYKCSRIFLNLMWQAYYANINNIITLIISYTDIFYNVIWLKCLGGFFFLSHSLEVLQLPLTMQCVIYLKCVASFYHYNSLMGQILRFPIYKYRK